MPRQALRFRTSWNASIRLDGVGDCTLSAAKLNAPPIAAQEHGAGFRTLSTAHPRGCAILLRSLSAHFRLRLTALIHMHMLDADSLRIAVPQTP